MRKLHWGVIRAVKFRDPGSPPANASGTDLLAPVDHEPFLEFSCDADHALLTIYYYSRSR